MSSSNYTPEELAERQALAAEKRAKLIHDVTVNTAPEGSLRKFVGANTDADVRLWKNGAVTFGVAAIAGGTVGLPVAMAIGTYGLVKSVQDHREIASLRREIAELNEQS